MYNSSIKRLVMTDLRSRELAIAKNHNESSQIKNSGDCGDGTEKGGDRERERERETLPNLIPLSSSLCELPPATMALSVSNLASSLSSLSFSSQVSQGPNTLSFSWTISLFSLPAKSARRASLSVTATVAAPAEVAEDDTMELKKYVKSRLPGGFAAQKIIGTGRRKCAIARVVLQEGTGKVIINYRDAKVHLSFLLHCFSNSFITLFLMCVLL